MEKSGDTSGVLFTPQGYLLLFRNSERTGIHVSPTHYSILLTGYRAPKVKNGCATAQCVPFGLRGPS